MRTALAIPHESSKTTITDDVRAGLTGQYAALLHAQIVRHRIYPEQALRRGEEGVVKLRLVLTRDGALREVKSLSDNPVRLVAASLEAVQAAVPFPPLPAALGSNEETFEVAVVYKIR
jgi:TonB family protein